MKILATLLIPACASAAIVGGQQAIVNGDFSAGFTGWSPWDNAVLDNGAVKLHNSSGIKQFFDFAGYPNQEYEFKYSFKLAAPMESWRLTIYPTDASHYRLKTVHGERLQLGGPDMFFDMGGAGRYEIHPDTWYHVTMTGLRNQPSTLSIVSDTYGTYTTTTTSTAMTPEGGLLHIGSFGNDFHQPMWVDNVSLIQTPEPTVSALLLIGVTALLSRRRRP